MWAAFFILPGLLEAAYRQALYPARYCMTEKRAIPTALGIVIGPAVAYLSLLIFKNEISEFAQCLCFVLLVVVGYDLARCRLSPTGILAVLFIPALPVAMYLAQSEIRDGNHLSAKIIIFIWVASTLLGALYAGTKGAYDNASSVKRLAILASGLLLVVSGSYFL